MATLRLAAAAVALSLSGFLPIAASASSNMTSSLELPQLSVWQESLAPRDPECPPCQCFDCTKPGNACLNSGTCQSGVCSCIHGFGGEDCSRPLLGGIADGSNRAPRKTPQDACDDGWSGLLCNVCQTNEACAALVDPAGPPKSSPSGRSAYPLRSGPVSTLVSASDSQEGIPEHADNGAVCYTGGLVVNEVHEMCDVTNRKILDMLPNRKPQVTFSCAADDATCNFQFWVGGIESFFCGLQNCSAKPVATPESNSTQYHCDTVQCSCIPERMLCGEKGSVDITDFLNEEIKGPGKFTCRTDGKGCKFEEPAMNGLINDIFGDGYITLGCQSGECMHYSQVPGFTPPPIPDNSRLVAASIASAVGVVLLFAFAFWYFGRTSKTGFKLGRGAIFLGGSNNENGDEGDKIMSDHVPAALHFSDVSYTVAGKTVLSGISGSVKSGQLLAIMGASGAGKTSFLDIIARRKKRGVVSGQSFVNGSQVSDEQFKRVVGFVDQEDMLLPTLTVYETVLYSALLRLPRDMSYEAKRLRTLETMHELGIIGIRDARIGESGKRSISGGEKRRVSIACELVTSPSILFLDEPTSGLDAFNAYNVIDSLNCLARDYQRTVVCTIHQPRSNIVSLFDKLLLLANGRTVYSGDFASCQQYFEQLGHPCPPGFNIADYLIDLTMQDELESRKQQREQQSSAGLTTPDEESTVPAQPSAGTATSGTDETELATRPNSTTSTRFNLSGRRAPSNGTSSPAAGQLTPRLAELVEAFEKSSLSEQISQDAAAASAGASQINGAREDGSDTSSVRLQGYKRASLWTQFKILSNRAFKNLYRNPMLMLSHYALSAILAVICSVLFANVTDDIAGFQNRMGLFFFILALFGFSSLTSLGIFANERMLFMRERANGYYSPITYFIAKVLFDIIPLRVVPPFVLGAIIYRPVGLVPTVAEFWKLLLVLILFNLAASSVVFLISIVISDGGVANLVGSLVMLFNLLFAGLLINREKLPTGTAWLQKLSFFHAAFEALLVNEVRYLQLKEHRYGVDVEVPSATILSIFGFKAQAFWWPDVGVLCLSFALFTALSFAALVFLVKERR